MEGLRIGIKFGLAVLLLVFVLVASCMNSKEKPVKTGFKMNKDTTLQEIIDSDIPMDTPNDLSEMDKDVGGFEEFVDEAVASFEERKEDTISNFEEQKKKSQDRFGRRKKEVLEEFEQNKKDAQARFDALANG